MKRANFFVKPISETIFSVRQGVYPVAAKKLAPYGRVDYSTRMDGADWAIRLTAFAAFAVLCGRLGQMAETSPANRLAKRLLPVVAWPWNLLAHFVCAFHFEHNGATAKRSPPLPSKPPKSPEQTQAWGCISTTPSRLSGWWIVSGGIWPSAVMRRGPPGWRCHPWVHGVHVV